MNCSLPLGFSASLAIAMFKINRENSWPPDLDLATARATLKLLERDMRRVPQLAGVAATLADALRALDKAEAQSPRRLSDHVLTTSRFMPDFGE